MITFTPAGDYLAIAFPFRLLEAFKRIVPHGYRWWQAEQKRWLINPPAFELLIDEWGQDFAPLDYEVLCVACPRQEAPLTPHEWNALRADRLRRAKYGKRKAVRA